MTEDDEEEQTKFEQWLDDKLGDKLGPIITAIFLWRICLRLTL
jgi:hypothetical protein